MTRIFFLFSFLSVIYSSGLVCSEPQVCKCACKGGRVYCTNPNSPDCRLPCAEKCRDKEKSHTLDSEGACIDENNCVCLLDPIEYEVAAVDYRNDDRKNFTSYYHMLCHNMCFETRFEISTVLPYGKYSVDSEVDYCKCTCFRGYTYCRNSNTTECIEDCDKRCKPEVAVHTLNEDGSCKDEANCTCMMEEEMKAFAAKDWERNVYYPFSNYRHMHCHNMCYGTNYEWRTISPVDSC